MSTYHKEDDSPINPPKHWPQQGQRTPKEPAGTKLEESLHSYHKDARDNYTIRFSFYIENKLSADINYNES